MLSSSCHSKSESEKFSRVQCFRNLNKHASTFYTETYIESGKHWEKKTTAHLGKHCPDFVQLLAFDEANDQCSNLNPWRRINEWNMKKQMPMPSMEGQIWKQRTENYAPLISLMLSHQLMNDFFVDWCTLQYCILFSMCPTPTMIGIMQSTKAKNFRPELSFIDGKTMERPLAKTIH